MLQNCVFIGLFLLYFEISRRQQGLSQPTGMSFRYARYQIILLVLTLFIEPLFYEVFPFPPGNSTVDPIEYEDVSRDCPFYNDVVFVTNNGIMDGTCRTRFSPYGSATRSLIASILYRIEGEPETTGCCPFDDVDACSNYELAIVWAFTNNLILGYSPTKFGPDDNITREQIVMILYRYAQYIGCETDVTAQGVFTDQPQIQDYAAVSWACETGLLSRRNDGKFEPDGFVTRAEVAAIFHSFITQYVG